ncbi:MAG: flavin-nucleotide-binding protein [Hyphomicrobiales bacterium]|nr:MAG: flavin-nucleotide-binding protein [Hyphomicrobiales bacterium]
MTMISTVEELRRIYDLPQLASTAKEIDRITPHYRALIEASPFVAVATAGPDGLDCSPRGDAGSVVHIHDEKTLMLPDRRGNNRIDTLINIVHDPRVGLMFLIPGSGTTLRINGTATLSVEPDLLASFAVDGKEPRSVMVIAVETVFFQCARAIVRADLWNPEKHVDPASLPTPGDILADLSKNLVGGADYDREWPERAKKTMW